MTEKSALIVGLTVLDVVNFCSDFPKEDEDVKILSQRWVKGGNAANTACVLAQNKNIRVDLMSCLSGRIEQKFIIDEITKSNVNIDNAVIHDDALFPSSNCIINEKNGSRTILHYRENFPEIPAEHFDEIDFMKYDWIHFEGRNTQVIASVISHIKKLRKLNNKPVISGEIEKPKRMNELLEHVAPLVDLLFISKDIGLTLGCQTPTECLKKIRERLDGPCRFICAWGDQGVAGYEKSEDEEIFIPAEKVTLVDSLGAGDTFIAAVISKLIYANSLKDSVEFANQVASRKCAQVGYDGLL